MPTNVEIKAGLRDFAAAAQKAAALSDMPRVEIVQEDVFFHAPRGRLKLRILAPDRGELIYYDRPDSEGPRISDYDIGPTNDPESLRRVLTAAYGRRGVVRKTRWLYMAGRTRIHLDQVEGLGEFLELEVVMRPGEDPAVGVQTAHELMAALGVHLEDLIEGAYIDLIEAKDALP